MPVMISKVGISEKVLVQDWYAKSKTKLGICYKDLFMGAFLETFQRRET